MTNKPSVDYISKDAQILEKVTNKPSGEIVLGKEPVKQGATRLEKLRDVEIRPEFEKLKPKR